MGNGTLSILPATQHIRAVVAVDYQIRLALRMHSCPRATRASVTLESEATKRKGKVRAPVFDTSPGDAGESTAASLQPAPLP